VYLLLKSKRNSYIQPSVYYKIPFSFFFLLSLQSCLHRMFILWIKYVVLSSIQTLLQSIKLSSGQFTNKYEILVSKFFIYSCNGCFHSYMEPSYSLKTECFLQHAEVQYLKVKCDLTQNVHIFSLITHNYLQLSAFINNLFLENIFCYADHSAE
jgi:hypothetical protein